MKASLAKHIFKGSLISISIPLILIFILAIKDFSLRNQLKIDNNYYSNLESIKLKRINFLNELSKIQTIFTNSSQIKDKSLKRIFKRLKKSILKSSKSLRLGSKKPYLNSKTLQKMNIEQHKEYIQKITQIWQQPSNLTRSSLIQLTNHLRKKFPLLTENNFILQYFSFEITYQYFSISDYILLVDAMPWVIEVIPTKKAGNDFLKNITTSQLLTQFPPKYTKIHDYLTSIKQLINFYPTKTIDSFFEFNFFSQYFEFYYESFKPSQKRIDFFEDENVQLKNITPAKQHGLGTFAVSLRTDNLFTNYLQAFESDQYFFTQSHENILNDLQNLNYFKNLSSLEIRQEYNYKKANLNDISNTLKSNESIQLRVKNNGNTYIINIFKDLHFNTLYHIFHSNQNHISLEKKAINSTSIALMGVILLFSILFYSYVLVIPKIIKPIHKFRKAIDQTTEDLSLSHVESFYSPFIEFQIMKKTFLRKIFRIRLQFKAAEALCDLQNLNSNNTNLVDFEKQCVLVYSQFFQKKYIRFDQLTNSVELEKTKNFKDNIYDPENLVLHDHSNFDAQVRFFYQRLKLHEEFLNTMQRDNELETAQVIQRNLLPSTNTQVLGINHTSFYKPARFLGGDFYDILSDESRTIILIADVSGKGLGSALFASSVNSYFAGQFYQQTPLEEMMFKTNNHTCSINPDFLFCTLFAIELDGSSNNIQYCSAGHNEMLLINNESHLLCANGLPLGLLEDQKYQKKSFEFNPDDLLLLYTDGVTEAESPSDELFGLKRLTQFLKDNKKDSTSNISDDLIKLLSHHASGTEQSDDITYMVIKKE